MFAYGTIQKNPDANKTEAMPETKDELPTPAPTPTASAAPPKQRANILIGAEVEYFRQTLNIRYLRLLLWIQLGLWVAILIFQLLLILIAVILKYHHKDSRPMYSIHVIGFGGLIGPLGLFLAAWVLSFFTIKKPKGWILGTAIGFQIASAVFALILTLVTFYGFLQFKNEYVPTYTKKTTGEPVNPLGGFYNGLCALCAIVVILCQFYILSCGFILVLFCDGTCCGTLLGNPKRLSGSPTLAPMISTKPGSITSSATFTSFTPSSASLHGMKGSQSTSSGQPRPSDAPSSARPSELKNSLVEYGVDGDKNNAKGADGSDSESRGTGLYLNRKLIRILLMVQAACSPLIMILGIVAAAYEGYYSSVDSMFSLFSAILIYSHPQYAFPTILTLILVGMAVGLTFIALKKPNGPRVGTALGFQVASAAGGCWILLIIFRILVDPPFTGIGIVIAMRVLIFLLELPVIVCSCMISVQFCRISCCGRFKVNAIGYCDIEYVIRSETQAVE